MRIRLKSYDVSMYVDSVSHSMNYTGGFTTNITSSCPSGTMLNAMVNYVNNDVEGEEKKLSDEDFAKSYAKTGGSEGVGNDMVAKFRQYETGATSPSQG